MKSASPGTGWNSTAPAVRHDGARPVHAVTPDVADAWRELPPFRRLPTEALDARLRLPADGAPGIDRAAPGRPSSTDAAARLATSPVAWLTTDPTLWPLIPVWPLLADAAAGMLACLDGDTRDPDVVTDYLFGVTGDVRRIACRAVAAHEPGDADEPGVTTGDTRHTGDTGDTGDAPGEEERRMTARLARRYAARADAEAFLTTHGPLTAQIGHVLRLHGAAFRLMTRRLAADRTRLADFGVPPHARLTGARAAGDLHEHGAVTVLTFHTGDRLLYKPRDLGLETGLARLLDRLEAGEPGLAPRVPASLDRGGYGWQEYVTEHGVPADAAGFYRRTGALLAVAYACRATDIHHENVICDGRAPVVVDPECFFCTSFHTTADGNNEQLGHRAATVLPAGILPEPAHRTAGDAPHDASTLGFTGTSAASVRRELRRDASGRPYLRLRDNPPGPVRHLPRTGGRTVTVWGYEDAFIDGFRAAYRWLMADRAEVERIFEDFRGRRVRHILRPTSFYVKLLWELGHPEATVDAVRQEEIVNTLWPSDAHRRAVTAAIFGHERRGLLTGCVPTFERAADGRDLRAGDEVVPGAFAAGGLDLARERLRALSADDLATQVSVIEAALAAGRASPVGRTKRYRPVEAEPRPGAGALDAAAAVRDILAARTLRTRGHTWWLAGRTVGPRAYGVGPAGPGLYDGPAGIALFSGYLDLLTGVPHPLTARAVAAMRADTERMLDSATLPQLARGGHLGAYDGLWGCVYAAACLGAAGDPDLRAWAIELGGALAPGVAEGTGWDLISGSSGIAAVAAELAPRYAPAAFRATAATALDATGDRLVPVLSGERITTGMAHGMSGVALAFQRGARLFPGEASAEYAGAARVALDAERSRRYDDDRGWHDELTGADAATQRTKREGWCRGAAGIGLARLAIARLGGPAPDAAELDAAARLADARAIGTDHALCHGALGALELLTAARPAEEVRHSRRYAAIAAATLDGRPVTALPGRLPDPGLMTGLAGIGYGLLRRHAPSRVPNVLTLELPEEPATP